MTTGSLTRPRIANIAVETLPVLNPLHISRTLEHLSNIDPGPPSPGSSRHEPGAGSPGHGDRDLLPRLHPTYQLGGVLTKLTQTNRAHSHRVALVLATALSA